MAVADVCEHLHYVSSLFKISISLVVLPLCNY